jgi:hypothetical protein
MIELSILEGNLADLECKLIEAICAGSGAGSAEEAGRLSGKLKALPKPDLRLVWDNKQKPPSGDSFV